MKQKEKPTKNLSLRLPLLMIMIITGAFCGYFLAPSIHASLDITGDFPTKMLLLIKPLVYLYIAVFLQIIIHELGHLVFGLCSGYTFASFRIGNFMLVKKDAGIQLKRFSLMGTGGQCLMIPPDMKNGRIPYVRYNLGGPLFNLLFSAFSYGLYELSKNTFSHSTFFSILAIVGIAFTLTNGIPIRSGAVNNDGYNAYSLKKNKEALWGFWLQLKINGLTTADVRLKDMPEHWFVVPSNEALKNSICATIGVFACARAIDEMNFDLARETAKKLLDGPSDLVQVHKNMLISELIFCELIGENRIDILKTLYSKEFSKYVKAMHASPSVIRMQYAYELLANHNESTAQKLLDKFEKIQHSYPHICEIQGERELLAYVQSIANAHPHA